MLAVRLKKGRLIHLEIRGEGHVAAPHLSCLGSSRESLRMILAQYKENGIKRLVALRGDAPSGYGGVDFSSSEFNYANELVAFIRAETGDWFHIEVAAYPEMHPQAKSPQDDVQRFAAKVKAGANGAIRSIFIIQMRIFALSKRPKNWV